MAADELGYKVASCARVKSHSKARCQVLGARGSGWAAPFAPWREMLLLVSGFFPFLSGGLAHDGLDLGLHNTAALHDVSEKKGLAFSVKMSQHFISFKYKELA